MASLGGRGFKPVFDICLRDRELRTAVEDVGIGRWVGVRELLERTGADWDRRTHRIRVLADAAAGGKCVETWQVAQPDNVDALVLRAEVEVVRTFRVAARDGSVATMRLDATVEACITAAKAAPTDPVPVVSLLTVARLYPGGQREIDGWWGELQRRDPFNREACHQVLRYFSSRYHGSAATAHNLARECAQRAPYGSPLAVLPLVARVEEFKFGQTRHNAVDLALNDIWISEAAMYDLDVAFDRWFRRRGRVYAQDVPDLHYLAHGLCFGNRVEQAAPIFELIGDLGVSNPWALAGDPAATFGYWRNRALGGRR
ncbi:MAG TPA: hypothetical protein VL551_27990 [Actinospica sp.]|nr:hypothetical protein [Actinospica sp.]